MVRPAAVDWGEVLLQLPGEITRIKATFWQSLGSTVGTLLNLFETMN